MSLIYMEDKNRQNRLFTICSHMDFGHPPTPLRGRWMGSSEGGFEREVKNTETILFSSRFHPACFKFIYTLFLFLLQNSRFWPLIHPRTGPRHRMRSFDRNCHIAQIMMSFFYVLASCTKLDRAW